MTNNHSICRHIVKKTDESPLFKCKGCSLNNLNVRKKYKDQHQCLLGVNNDQLVPIPVTKTTISSRSASTTPSGSNTPTRKYTNHLQMTTDDISITLEKKLKINKEIAQAIEKQQPTIHLDDSSENTHLIR
jgi:hypothetical protein